MKSKVLVAILAVAMSATLFTGCGTSNIDKAASSSSAVEASTSKGKTGLSGEITVLHHRTDMEKQMEGYIAKFQEENPDAVINMEAITDYQQTVMTRMSTKDYGDVLMIPADLTKNQYPDYFVNLGKRSEVEKEFAFLDNFTVDGSVYGLSTGANGNGFVYNEQVLKDAGVDKLPTSTDEYIDALKKIKEKTDAIPYYTNYVAGWTLTTFSNSLQISLSGDADYMNKMLTNKSEFLPGSKTYESLNLLYQAVAQGLCEEDPITSDWEKSKQMMADGKIGFMALGTWSVGQFQALSKNPENIKFMPAPAKNNGKSVVQIGSDFGIGVNINSDNKELAIAFAKFFCRTYPNDSNMISSLVGAELPVYLKGVPDLITMEQIPGTTEQARNQENIFKESLINLNDNSWIKTIVEIGLGNSKISFDDYMKKLNGEWVKGIEKVEAGKK